MSVEIIPLSESISLRASDYVEMYSLSHSMEMADALIASTCIEENETLITANDKHYRVVEGLRMTSSLSLLFPSCKTDILLVARLPFESASLEGRSTFDYGIGNRPDRVRYKHRFIDENRQFPPCAGVESGVCM